MNNKIFILAGTYDQFKSFVRKLERDMFAEGIPFRHRDFIYLTPNCIRGYSDIWGYKVGTWRDREDINDVYNALAYTFSYLETDFIEAEF
jgi:hypothetical protein